MFKRLLAQFIFVSKGHERMKTVFLSYRQTSDVERVRVRSFGERLRVCGINVVLDQFLLDEKPEGPADG